MYIFFWSYRFCSNIYGSTLIDDGFSSCLIIFENEWIVSEQGLKFAFDVRTTLNVSHVIFHPSTTSHGYDLYATSADKADVLFLNLEAGQLTTILF